MLKTQKKIISENPTTLRASIKARASELDRYLKVPRVNKKVLQAAFIPTNLDQAKSSSQVIEDQDLLNAKTTLSEIKTATLNEFDAGKLKALLTDLANLEKAVNSAAPRREFNKQKLL